MSRPDGPFLWSADLLELDAEAPALDVVLQVARTTARWIVLRRGARLYAVLTQELLELPVFHEAMESLRASSSSGAYSSSSTAADPDLSAAELLGLDQVAPTPRAPGRNRDPDPGDAPPELPTLGNRIVVVDGEGRALEVGDGATRPTPKRRSSVRRRSRSSVDEAAPPESHGSGSPPPTVRAGDPEAAADPGTGHEALEDAAADPPPPRPGGPDEGTSPVRFPALEVEGRLRATAPVTVVVDLVPRRPEETEGDRMEFPGQPEDWTELEVGFRLLSSGIDFDDPTGRVTVRRNAPSEPGRCRGTVREGLGPGSRIDVTAVFQHGGRFSGTALRTFRLEGASGAAGEPVAGTPGPGGPDGDATAGSVLVEVDAEPPDLTVQVMVPDPDEPGRLHWLMQPRELVDGLPPSLEEGRHVGTDTATYIFEQFQRHAQLQRGRHRRSIEGFGESLWRATPRAFRDTYWALWDHFERPFTIQFVSSEPNIPWELVVPSRDGESHGILALRHPVARWISSYRSYMRNRLPAGRLYTISPRYSSVVHRLDAAEEEADLLETRLEARRVPATYDDVLDLLETVPPPEPVALLHFSGHGRFAAGAVDASTIQLEDGALAVTEVGRDAVKLGEACRTLVFFNACEVGAAGSALGAMGGWADALLRRHFGGFIAPLWAVDDEDATTVCHELLEGIVIRREPVGSVLRGIRARYGDVSPTFLSYLFYGDVNARVAGGESGPARPGPRR